MDHVSTVYSLSKDGLSNGKAPLRKSIILASIPGAKEISLSDYVYKFSQ
jgi:hypothetical protein